MSSQRPLKLSIIIVSWNTSALLGACLQSVFAQPPSGPFDVWVVDNASTDDSVSMLRRRFPAVRLLANDRNVGFAEANNQAIERSSGEYILLLNPDTELKPLAIDTLVQFLDQRPQAGAAGARLLNPDGSLQLSCHPTPTLGREFWRMFHLDFLYQYAHYPVDKWDKERPREVDVLQGAALMLRREALDQVGLLDERYFMYSEEVDLCYRLQKANWPLFWVPQAKVLHYGGQSTQLVASDMFLQLYQAKLLYFRKHYGALTANGYKLILALSSLGRLIILPLALLQPEVQRNRNLTLGRRYQQLLALLGRL